MQNSVRKICTIAVFTALMCCIAPISIPLVPVAITFATLMVYLISAIFSWKIAPVIICLYILLGCLGLPVFSNFSSGPAVLFGPTGGYIFGYILAAIVESVLLTRFKNKKWMFPVAMIAATAVIYLFGSVWFMIYMNGKYTVAKMLMVCVVPFLLGDSLKIVVASVIGIRLRKLFDSKLDPAPQPESIAVIEPKKVGNSSIAPKE